jgi:hypothetical protein
VRSGDIQLILGLFAAESSLVNAVITAELLQLAVCGALAGKAALIVNGKD